MEKKYLVLAYYKYVQVENPHHEVTIHKNFFKNSDAFGRIYISEEGINGQVSASEEVAKSYIDWMAGREIFCDIEFKIHEHREHTLHKMTIKYRKELVALKHKVDLNRNGEHVSPQQWQKMLESGEFVVLDVRNDYEWEIGHFENSEKPDCRYFRDFPDYADEFKKKYPEDAKIMMCCTGGIRCETFSALLKEHGYKKVYQLDGGILKYGLEVGTKHWKGKLFVFDQRLSVQVDNKTELPAISNCHVCEKSCDIYYNCVDSRCDRLFLCCDDCQRELKGLCSTECLQRAEGTIL
ncbi:rhodanese-related sulfurtransferase [Candidatus Uabimicrobium sp. HlEnr_7]|uniref:oxygen-dependent tRNA uridine(34) hydroxylase TrhO n=1 Tax=Candidatus Uabimicrobium helgolandensis TaxID=3095367 RepID=UPI003558AA9E